MFAIVVVIVLFFFLTEAMRENMKEKNHIVLSAVLSVLRVCIDRNNHLY